MTFTGLRMMIFSRCFVLQDPHSVLLYKPQCSSSTSMVTTSVSSRESEATTSNQSSVKLEPTESPPCSEEMGREVTQTNRRQSAVTTTEAIPLNLLSSMMAYHERQAEQQVAVNYARPYHPAVQPYGRITGEWIHHNIFTVTQRHTRQTSQLIKRVRGFIIAFS